MGVQYTTPPSAIVQGGDAGVCGGGLLLLDLLPSPAVRLVVDFLNTYERQQMWNSCRYFRSDATWTHVLQAELPPAKYTWTKTKQLPQLQGQTIADQVWIGGHVEPLRRVVLQTSSSHLFCLQLSHPFCWRLIKTERGFDITRITQGTSIRSATLKLGKIPQLGVRKVSALHICFEDDTENYFCAFYTELKGTVNVGSGDQGLLQFQKLHDVVPQGQTLTGWTQEDAPAPIYNNVQAVSGSVIITDKLRAFIRTSTPQRRLTVNAGGAGFQLTLDMNEDSAPAMFLPLTVCPRWVQLHSDADISSMKVAVKLWDLLHNPYQTGGSADNLTGTPCLLAVDLNQVWLCTATEKDVRLINTDKVSPLDYGFVMQLELDHHQSCSKLQPMHLARYLQQMSFGALFRSIRPPIPHRNVKQGFGIDIWVQVVFDIDPKLFGDKDMPSCMREVVGRLRAKLQSGVIMPRLPVETKKGCTYCLDDVYLSKHAGILLNAKNFGATADERLDIPMDVCSQRMTVAQRDLKFLLDEGLTGIKPIAVSLRVRELNVGFFHRLNAMENSWSDIRVEVWREDDIGTIDKRSVSVINGSRELSGPSAYFIAQGHGEVVRFQKEFLDEFCRLSQLIGKNEHSDM